MVCFDALPDLEQTFSNLRGRFIQEYENRKMRSKGAENPGSNGSTAYLSQHEKEVNDITMVVFTIEIIKVRNSHFHTKNVKS